jgi:RimJ/RimL family protein N-acetyltransferase
MGNTGAIRTQRLILRPLTPQDAPAIAEGIGQWEVIRWLTTPPWPYGLADAEEFLSSPSAQEALALEIGGDLAGIIGLHGQLRGEEPDLGYWLNRRFHGQGYMSEAASAVVADHFARTSETLHSSHFIDNPASARILNKLGFRPTEIATQPSRPLGSDVEVQLMRLTREDWHG